MALRVAASILIVLLLFAPRQASAVAPPRPHYDLDVQLSYFDATLEVSQRIQYRNTTGATLDRLVLQVTTAYYGSFTLHTAQVDGLDAPWTLDGTVLEVSLADLLGPRGEIELLLDYSLDVPRQLGRFGAGPRALALGNWFPVLAPYRGDWMRHQYTDIGDAFFTEVADFDVRVDGDAGLVLAHSGIEIDHQDGNWTLQASGVRDFALVASPDFVRTRTSAGAATVDVYGFTEAEGEWYAANAVRYLEWYGGTFGTYPYPELDVAMLDLPAAYGGMEYPGLVMMETDMSLPDVADGSYAEYLLAHELAHQWFYAWVGNDEVRNPWLDEALATYAPLLYDRLERPELFPSAWDSRVTDGYEARVAAAGDLPVSSGLDQFDADPLYYAIVYRKGAMFLGQLHDTLGDEGMLALLREYVKVNHDRIATPRAFLDLAQAHTDENLNPLSARYFAYGYLTYPSPPRWTISTPPGPLSGVAPVNVVAEFPVDRLEVLLDGRTMYDGPLAAPALDLSSVDPGDYVLLVRLTDAEGALLERAVAVSVS